MHARSLILPVAVCGLAWLGGYGTHRLTTGHRAASPPENQPQKLGARAATAEAIPPLAPLPPLPADTLEDLLALPTGTGYLRTAQWLTHASAPEIARFHEAWKQRPGKDRDAIEELILLNWTRLDPQGALAAEKDLSWKGKTYSAWAAADPEAALKSAWEDFPAIVDEVYTGLGRYHPDWLLTRPGDIPPGARRSFQEGMASTGYGSDPQAAMDMACRYGSDLDCATLARWTRQDPQAAYAWLMENRRALDCITFDQPGPLELMAATIARNQPDLARFLADQTPPGEDRRAWERVIFDLQLHQDPAAAAELALATKNPRMAIERLATTATALAADDPDRALELVDRIFRINPNALSQRTWVGDLDKGAEIEGMQSMILRLLNTDPEGLMDLSVTFPAGEKTGRVREDLQNYWAERLPDEFLDWAVKQQDREVHRQSLEIGLDSLMAFERYDNAAERAMADYAATPDSAGRTDQALRQTFLGWWKQYPEAAAEWLEQAPLDKAVKKELKQEAAKEP